jgi:hypothetical protein
MKNNWIKVYYLKKYLPKNILRKMITYGAMKYVLLKEELEIFLIQKEHEHFSKNNQAYNDWLLMHAYDKLKFSDGMDEKHETLLKEKDNYASYAFVIRCLLITTK